MPLQLFASDLNAAGSRRLARASIRKTSSRTCRRSGCGDSSPRWTDITGSRSRSATSASSPRHNVLADPPFSRIDLISCRNLLIYLEPELQKKIMPILHYALKPTAGLWLGASETIGNYGDLFDAQDAKHKIYAKIRVREQSIATSPATRQSIPFSVSHRHIAAERRRRTYT